MVIEIEILIVGAGPAGLQLGYFLEKSGKDYLILERASRPGSFFETFPRHRQLISVNKRYTGYDDPEKRLRSDWNSLLSYEYSPLFTDESRLYYPHADSMVKYLDKFRSRHKINIQYDTNVVKITKESDGYFRVCDEDGSVIRCRILVIATGVWTPYIPDIEGIEHAELYTEFDTNPDRFENDRVLIIGKGNSAFETADSLIGTARSIHLASPRSVEMAWKTKFVGDLRAVNASILDTYQLKLQNVLIDANILSILKISDRFEVTFAYKNAPGEVETLIYDKIICCAGHRFDASVFEGSAKPQLTIDDRFPKQTQEWESVNVPGLYFAGTLMQARDYREASSAFIHGFRYNVQALFHIILEKHYTERWPKSVLAFESDVLSKRVIDRVNRDSALWLQTGFIADILVLSEDQLTVRHYEGMPIDVAKVKFGSARFWSVTLEFGKDEIERQGDPFALIRPHKDHPENASESPALHPIIRAYRNGEVTDTHHIIEDIVSEWREDVHVTPLRAFFESQVSQHQSCDRSSTIRVEEGVL